MNVDLSKLVRPMDFTVNSYGDAKSWMADTLHGRFTYGVDFAGKFYSQTADGERDHDSLEAAHDFVHGAYAERVLAALDADVLREVVEALAQMIYATTHLSAEEDDGSHWCRITRADLSKARRAYAAIAPLPAPQAGGSYQRNSTGEK